VFDHPRLREREGEKCANGIQRDQAIGNTAERNQEEAANDGENKNSSGEYQPSPSCREEMRKISIVGYEMAKTREVGEAGVRR
jgi:hypothetical protein